MGQQNSVFDVSIPHLGQEIGIPIRNRDEMTAGIQGDQARDDDLVTDSSGVNELLSMSLESAVLGLSQEMGTPVRSRDNMTPKKAADQSHDHDRDPESSPLNELSAVSPEAPDLVHSPRTGDVGSSHNHENVIPPQSDSPPQSSGKKKIKITHLIKPGRRHAVKNRRALKNRKRKLSPDFLPDLSNVEDYADGEGRRVRKRLKIAVQNSEIMVREWDAAAETKWLGYRVEGLDKGFQDVLDDDKMEDVEDSPEENKGTERQSSVSWGTNIVHIIENCLDNDEIQPPTTDTHAGTIGNQSEIFPIQPATTWKFGDLFYHMLDGACDAELDDVLKTHEDDWFDDDNDDECSSEKDSLSLTTNEEDWFDDEDDELSSDESSQSSDSSSATSTSPSSIDQVPRSNIEETTPPRSALRTSRPRIEDLHDEWVRNSGSDDPYTIVLRKCQAFFVQFDCDDDPEVDLTSTLFYSLL